MQVITRRVEGSPLECWTYSQRAKKEHITLHALMIEHDSLCYFCEQECIIVCGEVKHLAFHNRATIEHLFATSLGGANDMSNFVLACSRCNHKVGNLPVEEKSAFIRFVDINGK